MDTDISNWDGRRALLTRAAELAEPLSGFPVASLLREDPDLPDSGRTGPALTPQLLSSLLRLWVTMLTRDIERLPPTTMNVVVGIKQRMVMTRDALVEIQSLLGGLADEAPIPAGDGRQTAPVGYRPTPHTASSFAHPQITQ